MADSGKYVTLITGASSGIGMEIARLAAAEEKDLLLIARRQERLEELQRELSDRHGVSVWVLAKDLGEPNAPAEIADWVGTQGLSVENLVNNAGYGGYGRFHEQELDRNLGMIQLNISALVALTRLLVPGMISRGGGRILNVASTAGFLPGPLQAIYYSTKAFVVSFSQAIAEELRDSGITSTVLCPGPVATEFAQAADLEGATMMKFTATPQKVAKVGWRGMMRGRLVVSENKLLMFMLRHLTPHFPRRMVLKMSRRAQQK